MEPLLIGPEARIHAAAEEAGVSLDGMVIENTEHSHAAAARAVEMAARGQISVLIKGSLHTDELLAAVVSKTGGCGPNAASVTSTAWMCPPMTSR
ncbi:MAG: hypothetical protein M5U35_10810 [Roseovarius sp.]|nr:hypothetical protein [Roseovarius sp.]